MNALEVVPTKKESTTTAAGRPANGSNVTPTKKMAAVHSSNSSLAEQDVASRRKERSAPSSDNSREVRTVTYCIYICVWSLDKFSSYYHLA